jgi:polyisoprenoid-binding protein YceI
MRAIYASIAAAGALGCLAAPPALAAGASTDPAAAAGGHYEADPRHTSVTAKVRHLGLSLYTMRFNHIEGAYDYDPAHPADTKISIKIDARSLDTGVPEVSKQFAGQFLDADKNPDITFVSTAIQPSEAPRGKVVGDLTFHGATHPVTLDVTYDGSNATLIGGQRMGFSAITSIKRSEFGSTAYLGDVGDDVQVIIEAEFAKK